MPTSSSLTTVSNISSTLAERISALKPGGVSKSGLRPKIQHKYFKGTAESLIIHAGVNMRWSANREHRVLDLETYQRKKGNKP